MHAVRFGFVEFQTDIVFQGSRVSRYQRKFRVGSRDGETDSGAQIAAVYPQLDNIP